MSSDPLLTSSRCSVVIPSLLESTEETLLNNKWQKILNNLNNWQGKKIAMTSERNINKTLKPSKAATCMHKVSDN